MPQANHLLSFGTLYIQHNFMMNKEIRQHMQLQSKIIQQGMATVCCSFTGEHTES
jgi:hypothetical protein